jgi:putative ABC transport system permease protein
MPVLARMALRNLLRHPWRTLATVLGVGLGVASVLATLSVGDNVEANVRETLQAVSGPADLIVTPGATGRAVMATEELEASVRTDPAVAWVVPVLNTRAEPERDAEAVPGSLLPGIDSGFQLGGRLTEHVESLPFAIREGRLPRAGAREVVISEGFIASRGLVMGSTVVFASQAGPLPLTLVGAMDDRVALATTNGGRVGVTHLEDLQAALSLAGRASHLELGLRPGADVELVRSRVQDRTGDAFTVTFPAGVGDAASGIVQTLQAGLLILAATLMALGGFMAYNTFMAGVVERSREFALLRTVCLRSRDVLRLALAEALWVSLAGVTVGLLLGLGLSYGITRLNALVVGFEFRTLVVPVVPTLLAAAIGVLVALLAATLPAAAASRTTPLSALRSVDDRPPARQTALGWLLLVLGVVATRLPWSGMWALTGTALAMAAFFAGVALAGASLIEPGARLLRPLLIGLFGTPGRLGVGFTVRNAPRNGVAIGTVVVGVGLIIGVSAMVAGLNRAIAAWVDTTVVGDLFVTSPVPFTADFAARSSAVEGVEAVSGVGLRIVRYEPEGVPRGRSVVVVLVEPERFDPATGFGALQYVSGQGDARRGFEALSRGGTVLAANTIRDRFGVGIGDSARLRTDEGFQDFDIEGVVVDFTSGGETFIASILDLPRFGGGSPDLFVMTVEPGRRPGEVRDALLAAFPDAVLDVTLNAEYRAAILELVGRTFSTTNMLLVLAALIAALGVANTLGMNLSRRAFEIAMLRTLGFKRRDVRALVLAEGITVLSLGVALGVAFGWLLADVIVSGAEALTGYVIEPAVPWRLVVAAVVLTPLVGLVASLLPARRASRLAPRVALGAAERA